MSQFVVGEDGLVTEAAAAEVAQWYANKNPDVVTLDFEAHIMLVRAFAALRVDAPFVKKGGLTKPRYHVLRLLFTTPDCRLLMSDIVHAMNVSPTNVTKLVDGLEKDGYVRRVDNPRDKRKVWVELMPEGRKALEKAIPGVVEHINSLWVGLSTDEKRVLIHLLSKLRFGILADASNDQVEWIAKHPVRMPVLS